MKKRLLSAALALAMVLTLLPVSAFATVVLTDKATRTSPASGVTQVQYVYGTDFSKTDVYGNAISNAWAWQWTDTDGSIGGTVNKTYWASSTSLGGVVSGTSASGTWYDDGDLVRIDLNGNKSLYTSTFTLVGDMNLSNAANAASLSVNLFGKNLAIGGSVLNKVNSLTITDTFHSTYGGAAGTVTGISRNVTPYVATTPAASQTLSASGLTLNITGANVGDGISLTGRSNNVTLTDVAVTGDIALSGATAVQNTNGTTTTYDRQSLTINPRASFPVTPSTVSGTITVTGTGSSVNLAGVTGTSGATGAVTVNSDGGMVQLSNSTNVGLITVEPITNDKNMAPATVTINDATAAGVTYAFISTNNTANAQITVNAQGKLTDAITVDGGTVAIHSANVDDITLKQGTLNIDGKNGTVGDITLGEKGKTTLNFSGTGYTVDKLAVYSGKGGNLTIGSNWPTGRSNTFTALDLGGYTGAGIKGGIFGVAADDADKRLWFDSDLQFMRTDGASYAYYGTRELAAAIADAGSAAKGTISSGTVTAAVINVIGSTPTKYVTFYNSLVDANSTTANPVASLGYGKSTGIYLPDKINGTPVATWTNLSDAKEYSVNEEVPISIEATQAIKLVIQGSGAAVSKLTNVTSTGTNKNVTATLSGSQISVSGAVGQDSHEDIKLTLTTDLIDDNGNPVTFDVLVAYNTTTKAAAFGTLGLPNPPLGVTVNSNTIVVGSNTYTLSASGLAKPAANLKVAGISASETYGYSGSLTGKTIVPTVNVSGMGTVSRDSLVEILSGGEFDWTTSPAMRQVVNQAMATIINSNTLDNYVTTAQRAAWNLNNRGKTPTESDLNGTGYDTAVLEPYLALTVTAYNESGVMTASLVPSYRVLVVSSNTTYTGTGGVAKGKSGFTTDGYYIAQQGRALSTPINDLTGTASADVGVKLKLDNGTKTLPTGFASAIMHQDSTYVYSINTGAYTITRAGKTGLGTIELNKTPALVTMQRYDSTSTAYADLGYAFDNLQAAVDVTEPQAANQEDKITVTAAYTGSGVIDVTGAARSFTIVTQGQTTITPANNNFTVGVDTTGHTYTVQLQKNVTVETKGNITINSATGGSASVSANPATVGQTVNITLVPVAGYVSSGVAVRDANNSVVSVSGSGNSYSFVMPSGSVTVTPAFAKTQPAKTTVSVSSNNMGNTTTTAAATNNQVDAGSNVGVTTYPASGYRTMGVNITTNGGATTAARQGDNYFTFTVPANATAVTVTPVYDRDNGTKFSDVWSTEYYSDSVAWAVKNNITTGTGTYTFSPGNTCTRAQMVTFLWRAAGRPSVAGISNPFVDVSTTLTPGDYYSAILWAVSKGITNGVDATHFGPNQTVTRAQAVTFLYRYEGSPAASTNSGFYDVPSKEYYAKAVSWAASKGITNGTSTYYFSPSSGCQRAQIVTFLYRDVNNIRA